MFITSTNQCCCIVEMTYIYARTNTQSYLHTRVLAMHRWFQQWMCGQCVCFN